MITKQALLRAICMTILSATFLTLVYGHYSHAQESADESGILSDEDSGPAPEMDLAPAGKDAGKVKLGSNTNLPIPRFVSLKTSAGNARRGPSLSHRIDWVFKHRGMPLKVTAEYGNWRRVEDRDGAGGWVHYALISGVRTVVIQDAVADLHAKPDDTSAITARAESGAILHLGKCSLNWCDIRADGAEGWVKKSAIWGVDPDEIRD
ncbi:SH3 domain-containing protein [Thioclava kandeliae]